MYLTQLQLKRLDRSTIKSLADIYRLHQTVMKGFVAYTDTERILYRVEPEEQNGLVSILVQSPLLPDWQPLTETHSGVVSTKIKEFTPKFQRGQQFTFRLRANTTVTDRKSTRLNSSH